MSIFSRKLSSAPSNVLGLEALAPEQNDSSTQTADQTEQANPAVQSDPASEGDVATQDATTAQTETSVQTEGTADQSQGEPAATTQTDGGEQSQTEASVDASITNTTSEFTSSITAASGLVRRPSAGALYQTMSQLDAVSRYDRAVHSLHSTLADLEMITAFTGVAKEYNLSAPLVAAFQATPGFVQAVKSFPALDSFNLHPSHPTSADNVLGLESFQMAETQTTDVINQRAASMASAFADVLGNLDVTISALSQQISDTKASLEASDITDVVLTTMSANLIPSANYLELLNKFENYLTNVDPFDVDELRAHPQQVMTEADGVAFVVGDVGGALGLSLGKFGLVEGGRDQRFEASQSTFADAGYGKTDLMFLMDKADGVLSQLKSMGDRKEELTNAVSQAVTDMPAMVEGNDVSYGGLDHVTLLNCYTTLHTSLVRESMMAVTTLLAAVDSVVNIDTGVTE